MKIGRPQLTEQGKQEMTPYQPEDFRWFRTILRQESIPNTGTGMRAWLECGHVVFIFGRVPRKQVLCDICRDNYRKENKRVGQRLTK
jgi:hypothetical protein